MSDRTSKKKQKQWYSGKKKKHTIKTQLVVNKSTEEIICVAEDCGRTHDFNLYKNTIGGRVLDSIKVQSDSGYQGIAKYHKNSETPKKKPKGGELTPEEKAENKRIARERILIENINAKFKVFKIMANKYRNRRTRHALRANIISGIINFEARF
jgi:hypothetical protein